MIRRAAKPLPSNSELIVRESGTERSWSAKANTNEQYKAMRILNTTEKITGKRLVMSNFDDFNNHCTVKSKNLREYDGVLQERKTSVTPAPNSQFIRGTIVLDLCLTCFEKPALG